MLFISGTVKNGCEVLPASAAGTAQFVSFMDQLFDSVNSSSINGDKPLRSALTKVSPHWKFWDEALPVLRSMRFIDSKGNRTVPICVRNWILTIENLRYLWATLEERGFKFLCLRSLNQDPVENFFGSIRAHGLRNTNPTPHSFGNSFKALVINNFMGTHSAAFNCEDDKSVGALDNLRKFVVGDCTPEEIHEVPDFTYKEVPVVAAKFSSAVRVYVSGYVARKVLQITKGCVICKADLLSAEEHVPHDSLIEARAYSKGALCRPNTGFTSLFNNILSVAEKHLPNVVYKYGVAKILIDIIIRNVCFSHLTCRVHAVKDVMLTVVVKLLLFCYCKNVNEILMGSNTIVKTSDPIKLLAQDKYKRSRKRKMQ